MKTVLQVGGFYLFCLMWVLYGYTPFGDWVDSLYPAGYALHPQEYYSSNGMIGDPENLETGE